MSAAAKALSIAGTDLRRLYRDRTALFFMLLLPVFIILLIGLAFGSQGSRLRVGVVDVRLRRQPRFRAVADRA